MKKLLVMLLMLTMVVCFAACGQEAPPAAEPDTPGEAENNEPAEPVDPIVIKLGTTGAVESSMGDAMNYLVGVVEERMGGEVILDAYYSESLGSDTQQVENLQVDLQQAWAGSLDVLAAYATDLNIITMAFAFDSVDHLNAFLASEYGDAIESKLEAQGMVLVSYNFNRPPRGYISTSPITCQADMEGKKYRVPNIEIFEKNASAMGATPVYIAWGEYTYGLMTGVVDMGETTYEQIAPMNFYQYAPYITCVDYAYAKDCLCMSIDAWNSMSEAQQQLFKDCVKEAEDYYNGKIEAQWEADKTTIVDGGGIFVEDFDRQSFMDVVPEYAAQLEAEGFWETPGLFEKIQEIAY